MKELDFLVNIPILNNDDNRDSIFNWLRGEIDFSDESLVTNSTGSAEHRRIIFKQSGVNDTNSIKNYYKGSVYRYSGDDSSNLNPYLKLVRDFSNDDESSRGMRIHAADFAYLTKLGVYPLNRLWVLRRYPDGVLVQNRLDRIKVEPISTMIGWIEPGENELMSIGFNEYWMKIDDNLPQIFQKMLSEEFRLKTETLIPVPGFTQGLLFEFLNRMGLTDYDFKNIPQGDPSVLQEAAARATNSKPNYGNQSNFQIKLNTSYEQKFIGDVDPGTAMLDIIHNCLKMGTRNTKYVFGGKDEHGILRSLRQATSGKGNDSESWWKVIKSLFNAFVGAINSLIEDTKKLVEKLNLFPSEVPSEEDKSGIKTDDIFTALKSVGDSLVGSTLAKWRYAIQGSIGVMTGEATTPWHLTIGNPYSPYISMANVIVKNVVLKPNNEFGFNDIPTRLNVEVGVEQGRNMGANEIFEVFNNGYQRAYVPRNNSQVVDDTEQSVNDDATDASTGATINENKGVFSGRYFTRNIRN